MQKVLASLLLVGVTSLIAGCGVGKPALPSSTHITSQHQPTAAFQIGTINREYDYCVGTPVESVVVDGSIILFRRRVGGRSEVFIVGQQTLGHPSIRNDRGGCTAYFVDLIPYGDSLALNRKLLSRWPKVKEIDYWRGGGN
jgi:hypothetical protein